MPYYCSSHSVLRTCAAIFAPSSGYGSLGSTLQAEHERVLTTAERVAALDVLLSEKIVVLEKLPEAVSLVKAIRNCNCNSNRSACLMRNSYLMVN